MTLAVAEPEVVGDGEQIAQRSPRRFRTGDVLLPAAVVLWLSSTARVETSAIDDFGLLAALPITFYVALALTLASIVVALGQDRLSPVRLGANLAALVLLVHGTAPMVFATPIYPWLYKHVGVIAYIDLHGTLDTSIDIYHNWPGFFAVGAWFTEIAGIGSPLAFAAWAPVYFNLLTCLELGFVASSLGLGQRARWLALFFFVGGNWVGQDYFAPQALAVVLSLAVFALVLRWLRVPRRGVAPAAPAAALAAIFAMFAVVVVSHQLSPFMILAGLGLLTVAGMVRPRWLVFALGAMTFAYLFAHMSFVERSHDLLGSLGRPFQNLNGNGTGAGEVAPGRRLTALAAPAVVLQLWALAAMGVLRRRRAGLPVLAMVLMAGSPVLIVLGQSYGGEAVFRVYLFSLPWVALLAASAFATPGRRPRLLAASLGGALPLAVALTVTAFYGSMELYEVRPAAVEASSYFYEHAERGSMLAFVAPGFPVKVGASYDEFVVSPSDSKPNLTANEEFRGRMLGEADLPAIGRFMEAQLEPGQTGYLALSTEQQVHTEVLGLLPAGSLPSLDRALAGSADWQLFHRTAAASIYRYTPQPAAAASGTAEPAPDLDPTSTQSAPGSAPPATWTVQPGDSLWSIAAHVVGSEGDVAAYRADVVAANRPRLRDHDVPDLIYAGEVVVLPGAATAP